MEDLFPFFGGVQRDGRRMQGGTVKQFLPVESCGQLCFYCCVYLLRYLFVARITRESYISLPMLNSSYLWWHLHGNTTTKSNQTLTSETQFRTLFAHNLLPVTPFVNLTVKRLQLVVKRVKSLHRQEQFVQSTPTYFLLSLINDSTISLNCYS